MEIRKLVEKSWLLLPSCSSGNKEKLTVDEGNNRLHAIEIPFLHSAGDFWWAAVAVSELKGREILIRSDCEALLQKTLWADEPPDINTAYGESLRPQFHFSPRCGWLNDPNGLIFFNGLYHLFFQHNPYATEWGNMHWGHAVSGDLFHWRELGIALYPDALGTMFSGSAVTDRDHPEAPIMALLYTAAHTPDTQCLAFSSDGLEFEKYSGNPVIDGSIPQCRDPKVFRHSETDRWIMVLYAPEPVSPGEPSLVTHSVRIYSSSNLVEWNFESKVTGGTGPDAFLYECPDLFPLPGYRLGEESQWILTGANGEYQSGDFDGRRFTPTSGRLRVLAGDVSYAAQTFNDEARDRRIALSWLKAPTPGMPFTQCLSLPLELSLAHSEGESRLRYWPAEEIASLWRDGRFHGPRHLEEGECFVDDRHSGPFDFFLMLDESSTAILTLSLRGLELVYHAVERMLVHQDQEIQLPVSHGAMVLRVIIDRSTVEIFAASGLVYFPLARLYEPGQRTITLSASKGFAKILSIEIHEMAGTWKMK